MTGSYGNLTTQEFNRLYGLAMGAGANHYDMLSDFNSQAIGMGVLIGGQGVLKGYSLWKNNGKSISGAWNAAQTARAARSAENAALKGNNVWETLNNRLRNSKIKELGAKYAEYAPESVSISARGKRKYLRNIEKSKYYDNVRQLINQAKGKKGAELKSYLKQIEKALADAKLNIHNASISGNLKPVTKTGKAFGKVKKYTGYNAVKGKALKASANSKTMRGIGKCLKGAKGNALFAVLALASESGEIIDAYKENSSVGNKKLVQKGIVIGAEIGGYAVGSAAGAAIGAAIGTAACPIIGTAIGAACGIAVSCLAGWVARNGVEDQGNSDIDNLLGAKKAQKDSKQVAEVQQKAVERLASADMSDTEAQELLALYEKGFGKLEILEAEQADKAEKDDDVLNQLEGLKLGYTA